MDAFLKGSAALACLAITALAGTHVAKSLRDDFGVKFGKDESPAEDKAS